jgi:hypothetical protein
VPAPEYALSKFKYEKGEVDEKGVYICPCGQELKYIGKNKPKDRILWHYRNAKACSACKRRGKCSESKQGRTINRWEHEEIMDEMRERLKKEKLKYKSRQQMSEHPFGTIKRGFNQGYMLMKGLRKVNGELGLTALAYNMRRVMNIMGVQELIDLLRNKIKNR